MDGRRIARILSSCDVTARYFKGVYPSNAIETPMHYPATMVVNLDEADEPGSHWVAIYMKSADDVLYFDSYGRKPEGPIKEFLRGKRVRANQFFIQSIISDVCGYYCIYVIYRWSRGDSYARVLTGLGKKQNIDLFVRSFVRDMVCDE